MQTLHKQGAYYAGEQSVLFRHRLVKSSIAHRGCIFLTGSTSDATQALQFAPISATFKAITELGVDVFSIDGGGTATWGNDVAIARTGDALTYMRNTLGITGKVAMLGYSMGGIDSQNFAARNPNDVAGFMGFAPVCDLDYHEANTHKAPIDTAYGGAAAYQANSEGHDPIDDLVAPLSAMPWKAYYATDDATIPPATVLAMAAAVGGTTNTATGGHVNFWNEVDPSIVANYVAQILGI